MPYSSLDVTILFLFKHDVVDHHLACQADSGGCVLKLASCLSSGAYIQIGDSARICSGLVANNKMSRRTSQQLVPSAVVVLLVCIK